MSQILKNFMDEFDDDVENTKVFELEEHELEDSNVNLQDFSFSSPPKMQNMYQVEETEIKDKNIYLQPKTFEESLLEEAESFKSKEADCFKVFSISSALLDSSSSLLSSNSLYFNNHSADLIFFALK